MAAARRASQSAASADPASGKGEPAADRPRAEAAEGPARAASLLQRAALRTPGHWEKVSCAWGQTGG